MFGHWLNKIINGASCINRWQGRRKLIQRNDAEHMWSVSVIAEGLARIEEEQFGNKVDVALLLRKCIFHDCLEVETGDIASGVKRKTQEMKDAINGVELAYYKDDLEKLIPKKWRNEYSGFLLNPKDGHTTIEGKILAVADNIDALNECIQEIKVGNISFKPYLREIAKAIMDIDLDSGKYFLKYCLLDFDLPLNEYGEEIKRFVRTYEFTNINTEEKKAK